MTQRPYPGSWSCWGLVFRVVEFLGFAWCLGKSLAKHGNVLNCNLSVYFYFKNGLVALWKCHVHILKYQEQYIWCACLFVIWRITIRRILSITFTVYEISMSEETIPDNKFCGANMRPTLVLSAPDGPHIGPTNLSIRDGIHYTVVDHIYQQCFLRWSWMQTSRDLACPYVMHSADIFHRILSNKNLVVMHMTLWYLCL